MKEEFLHFLPYAALFEVWLWFNVYMAGYFFRKGQLEATKQNKSN